MPIQKQYAKWCALRTATETCSSAHGGPLVREMGVVEVRVAGLAAIGLQDMRAKLLMSLGGAAGMVESVLRDMEPFLAAAE
jgi:hypothetical protein